MNTSAPTRVVVGVSGSQASRRAVETGAREAGSHECPLHLVHAFDWSPGNADESRELLQRAVAVAAHTAPAITITSELVAGDALAGLLHLSRRAALTVIGDGNLNELVCLPPEKMAVQLAARAADTVMITRAAPAPYGRVLVGITEHPLSDEVLDFAFEAATLRRTGLLVVHVRENRSHTQALEDVVESRAHAYGVDAQLHILDGDPTEVVTRESREASLIVVGARGELPYHGLLGSVTQTLLHHGRAPMVVARSSLPVPRPHSAIGTEATPVTDARGGAPDSPLARSAEKVGSQ